ncbi:Hypothetical predicted protein [Podarcis lilfordi]|uniref:Uncharacterized protein n=1 Tax=Podarcis lilfordi TaxID=74358 RepID=A0AA35JS01_9SAUR|nr:Hypothetical predicted protein [Podarcis lilfordi]
MREKSLFAEFQKGGGEKNGERKKEGRKQRTSTSLDSSPDGSSSLFSVGARFLIGQPDEADPREPGSESEIGAPAVGSLD